MKFRTPNGSVLNITQANLDAWTDPVIQLDEANRTAIQAVVDARYPAPAKYPDLAAAMAIWPAIAERIEAQIAGPVSRGERDSWTAKEAEARAWVADNQAATPILSAEAAVTGETMADLTAKVITRADALKPITGEIAGLRRATELALAAAAEPDDYETILQTAQAQAIALAAARGITLEA